MRKRKVAITVTTRVVDSIMVSKEFGVHNSNRIGRVSWAVVDNDYLIDDMLSNDAVQPC